VPAGWEAGEQHTLVRGDECRQGEVARLDPEPEADEPAVEDRDRREGPHLRERAGYRREAGELAERGDEPAVKLEADSEQPPALQVDRREARVVQV
jgi:hypothetical protein